MLDGLFLLTDHKQLATHWTGFLPCGQPDSSGCSPSSLSSREIYVISLALRMWLLTLWHGPSSSPASACGGGPLLFMDIANLSAAHMKCSATAALGQDPKFCLVWHLLADGLPLLCSTSMGTNRMLLLPSFHWLDSDALHSLSHPGVCGSGCRLIAAHLLSGSWSLFSWGRKVQKATYCSSLRQHVQL